MLKKLFVYALVVSVCMPYNLVAQDLVAQNASASTTEQTPAATDTPQPTPTPVAAQSGDAQPSATAAPATGSTLQTPPAGFVLLDGVPVRLRLSRNLSSGTDRKGDTVDFEVLEDIMVDNVIVIQKGGTALGTITEAEPKRRMGRGGKLDVVIESVRLKDNEKVALRAVKENKGGGHVGAMTGAMVATSIVFFPAAPLFLFMKGKDINIPKGTEITAYVEGNATLDRGKFDPGAQGTTTAATAAQGTVAVNSVPAGADVEVDGSFIGNTPSQVSLPLGDHVVKVSKTGFKPWERKLKVTSGSVTLNADLETNN